jgi:hypothetical protein
MWPYWVIRKAFRQMDRVGRPGIVYFHPYEYDPSEMAHYRDQVPLARRLHQGLGRRGFQRKIDRLLVDFRFGPLREVLADLLSQVRQAPA